MMPTDEVRRLDDEIATLERAEKEAVQALDADAFAAAFARRQALTAFRNRIEREMQARFALGHAVAQMRWPR